MPKISPSPSLKDFFKSGKLLRFSKGEIVINGNEQPDGVYFIDRGYIKVYAISDDGEEYIHIIYKAGEVFPLVWALKGVKRRVFYESLGDSVLWRLSKEDFLELSHNDLTASKLIVNQLTEQFRIFADRVDNLEYKRSKERLVYRLLFMASRFGVRRDNHVEFEAVFTQQTIAGTINMARESVTREFEKLQAKGLVSYRNRRIVITDLDGLTKELSEPVDMSLWGLVTSFET